MRLLPEKALCHECHVFHRHFTADRLCLCQRDPVPLPERHRRKADCSSGAIAKQENIEKEITTTGLAGGLLCPYKGLLPALESKDSSNKFAKRNIIHFR